MASLTTRAALALLALGAACDRSARRADPATASPERAREHVQRELTRRFPELDFAFRAPDTATTAPSERPAPYRTLWFTYQMRGQEWPYGSGFALWLDIDGDRAPRWWYLHRGDSGPGQIFWADLNDDRRSDIYFLAGEEDVYSTYLFVNRGDASAFTDSAFTLAYSSENDYSTLVDLDADGTPEIIDSGHPGDQHVDFPPGCDILEIPPDVRDDAAREYRRIVGAFGGANFDYGRSGSELEMLHLLDPVRILRARGAGVEDVTRDFPDHLRWRAGLLERLRGAGGGEACRRAIEEVLGRMEALRH